MWAEYDWLVTYAISRGPDGFEDGRPCVLVSWAGQVPDVLQDHVARSLCPSDLHDVKEESPARAISDSQLGSRLGERLAREPGTEHVVVWNSTVDLRRRQRLAVGVCGERSNIRRESMGREFRKGSLIDPAALWIEFAGHGALSAKRRHGMVKPADAGE